MAIAEAPAASVARAPGPAEQLRASASARGPQVGGLFATVVSGGYCIGCGACAAVAGSPVRMNWTELGQYEASVDDEAALAEIDSELQAVCPFSATSANEDELADELFAVHAQHHPKIGYYTQTYVGFVDASGFRQHGSSGGMGSWLGFELMRIGEVDGLIHVRPRTPTAIDGRLFEYAISTSAAQIEAGAKSRYYPIELSNVLAKVRERPGRYALVGVPCFIKAVRLLARNDRLIAERITCCIALFCGHLKSAGFAESLAWQCGISPNEIGAIDFRHKLPDRAANDYGLMVQRRTPASGEAAIVRPMRGLIGADWGMGFFKYKACDYCDDVVGELADISVGDAWLPEYLADAAGTNVVIVRRPDLGRLIEQAMADGRLQLAPIAADRVAASQDAGLRHRREGLAYRLQLQDKAGRWRPPKRVQPRAAHLGWRQRRIFRSRVKLAQASHQAYLDARKRESLDHFRARMEPLMRSYYANYRSLWRMVLSPMKRLLTSLASDLLLRRR